MARYSFSDTTLTALGDVVRSKSVPTALEWRTSAPGTVRMGSPNAGAEWGTSTGDCNQDEVAFYRDGGYSGYGIYYFKCEDADRIELKLGTFYVKDDYCVIIVCPGELQLNQVDFNTAVVDFNTWNALNTFSDTSATLTGGSYTVVIGYNNKGQYLSEYWMMDITAYDADNNLLPIEYYCDGKKLLTLAEMTTIVETLPKLPAPIVLTGNQNYGCARSMPAAFITTFPDLVTTKDLTDVGNMFYASTLQTIPFDINISRSVSSINMNSLFSSSNIRELPNIPFAKPSNVTYLFNQCNYLKEIPEGWSAGWDWSYYHSYNYASGNAMFHYCQGLRRVASDFLKECWSIYTSSYSGVYYQTFYYCYSLDEVVGLGVSTATYTSNMFNNTVSNCYRLKRFTFDTDENGKAKTANWKNQTIDLTYIVGDANYVYQSYSQEIYPKRVTDDATYQALKDDPDWWTTDAAYCRYNHDSAVETINSLPDTKTYIALNGGTNTIKFRGTCGFKTEGGAVSNLTKEEIAVATAKGWTVSIT